MQCDQLKIAKMRPKSLKMCQKMRPPKTPTFFCIFDSDEFGPGPSPKARRPEAIFLSPTRPEPDFLKVYSIENFGLGPKARRPEAIFFSPARPEPDFFQLDPSLIFERFRGGTEINLSKIDQKS